MPAMKHRLLLAYSSELVNGAPLYLLSNSFPVPWVRKEPAGHSFHEAALCKLGYGMKDKVDYTLAPEKKEKTYSPSVDSYHFKGKKKNNPDGDQQDHYALLGLSHLRFLATEEQIRKSYRDVALKHHPDKQAALLLLEETEEAREAKKEEIDRHFKSIQEAYEVLIDPTKRRLYDSIDEFDDEIPSECSVEDFFKVFGPVFLRNGRWSITQPVPSLGDDDTSISDVDMFYDFWWSFKSWREFPHADEFDLEQAESREHKRWMERQNGKLREKAKKEETGRIRTLIENAYKRDPRIVRRKEEEKAEKMRKKQAKVLAKQEKELEAARLLEEKRLRKLEEDRKVALEAAALRKVREKEKKLLRKERQRLRAAAAAVIARKDCCISDDAIDSLCTSLEIAEMTGLCEKLEDSKGVGDQVEILRGALRGSDYENCFSEVFDSFPVNAVEANLDCKPVSISGNESMPSSGRREKGVANGNSDSSDHSEKTYRAWNGGEKKVKTWTKEEVELLRKAVAKYPKGTSQRWEVVSNYIGTGRTVEEILRAIKTVLLQKPDTSKAFDSFLSQRKHTKDIASPLSFREDMLGGGGSVLSSASEVVPNGAGRPHFDPKDKFEGVAVGVINEKYMSPVDKVSSEAKPQVQSYGNTSAISNGGTDPEVWSETQELALVKALKTFPKDTAQRWERIAAAVPVKSKAQCFKKFAELRENFRSKKGLDLMVMKTMSYEAVQYDLGTLRTKEL
uniref:DnaJ subfamily C member 2-like protein n=1 Tax=Apopellia endiviifolia (species B) TaxID=119729 RepID=A0A6B7NVU5_9MARC|nr:DnaJ subfamily C member 2-like protein [Apopellia endiviifolia (species B)]